MCKTDNAVHEQDAIASPLLLNSTGGSTRELAFRDAIREIADEVLRPAAEESDQADGPNLANFKALAEAGLFGMSMPEEYGGLNISGAMQREVTEILASACGVTTFVQGQHHGSSRMIANGPNQLLKQHLLPDLVAGRTLCAISFAYLRRPGPPVLRAEATEGGYLLEGTAPWVTGWGLMRQVVIGAGMPDGRFGYFWVPGDRNEFPEVFEGCHIPDNPGLLTASKPLPLCAMNASATVELTCSQLFVPSEHLLSYSDRETMARNDKNGILGGTALPIGCAAGSVRLLCEIAERRKIAAVSHAADKMKDELSRLRSEVHNWQGHGENEERFRRAVELRAWAIQFAVRAAHACVTASSGAANSLTHPAQRLFREAMFYTIQAQTQEVMAGTLELITTPPY